MANRRLQYELYYMQKVNIRFLRNSLLFFFAVWAIHQVFSFFPAIYETIYLNGIFKLIRNLYDYLIGIWLPFPMIVIAAILILLYIFYPNREERNLLGILLRLVGKVAIVLSFFYIFWGWNYAQKSISHSLGLGAHIEPDSARLIQEAFWAKATINTLRDQITSDSTALITLEFDKNSLELQVRDQLKKTLAELNLPYAGRPRIRAIRPRGLLLRFKTAGIYMPYAFEGHIDAGMLKIEWPYTIAHEMSHGFGITDEGACNFIAFIACMESQDPLLQYSAMIDYTLYVLRDVYRMNPELHRKIYMTLSPSVRADIQAIRDNNAQYPDILPSIRDFLYDSYLKSHGVTAGLSSYSQLTGLVIQYKDLKAWKSFE